MLSAFIIVLGMLVYAWILYPAVVLLLGRKAGPSRVSALASSLPPVAVLFSAHNEEAVILKRLENLAALDYPLENLQVFIGVDGGNDRTAEIALEWAGTHPNVHVIVSATNRGKSAMLKQLSKPLLSCQVAGLLSDKPKDSLFASLTTEQPGNPTTGLLLIFTDANTMFAPDALRQLVAPFADPQVGGVCGRLVFLPPKGAGQLSSCQVAELSGDRPKGSLCSSSTTGQPGNLTTSSPAESGRETVYWDLETRLKAAESRLDSCLGANGAIYAIRAELFPTQFPDNTIIDDFVIGMKVREQGYRLVYESSALANEELPATVNDEWRRRVRIGAGAYQALALCWRCLLPRYGVFAWMFWSHKALRWFTPHLLVLGGGLGGGLLSCHVVELSGKSPEGYVASATRQPGNITTFLCIALAGMLLAPGGRKVLKLAGYFITMQAALFVGFLRYCRGGLKGNWARTERNV